MEINNRKTKYNYQFLEQFVAGIKLLGSEVKSIRNGDVSMDECFCLLTENGLVIKNMYIKEYEFADRQEPLRDRVLLLNKSELKRIKRTLINKGLTIIPSKLFINKQGLVKVVVNIAKGRKNYEKVDYIKERDIDKNTQRELKSFKL